MYFVEAKVKFYVMVDAEPLDLGKFRQKVYKKLTESRSGNSSYHGGGFAADIQEIKLEDFGKLELMGE